MAVMRLTQTLAALALLSFLPACRSTPFAYHKDPRALGPYSSAVEFDGLVVLSGKIAASEVRGTSFEAEVESTIDAIENELRGLGLELADAVSATVYLTDMGRYGEFNRIYGARFPAPYPARVCVAVAALPGGAQVEIQVTARRS